ncbi:hypothetical protein M1523_03520 [Patescibacteria group bacterium]|nr:hypothetical protein [Patescibacteria group bacterium]MCL5092020.1 hypothetical protein [Patescibacteria group bacterium]
MNVAQAKLPQYFLQNNGCRILKTGSLTKITVDKTESNLIKNNGNVLYACMFYGLEGLFRKDKKPTFIYGRKLCDQVKQVFNCGGFFTSDELPNYGISPKETRYMFARLNKKEKDGNLIVFFLYNEFLSKTILAYLTNHFQKQINPPSTTGR